MAMTSSMASIAGQSQKPLLEMLSEMRLDAATALRLRSRIPR